MVQEELDENASHILEKLCLIDCAKIFQNLSRGTESMQSMAMHKIS